jgi:prepilin-type N-terminal cleavage/methylation domain-containing protein
MSMGGFSLTELAVVLVIVALLAGYFFTTGAQFIDIGKRKETETKLKAIEEALAGYIAVNGRLPCPSNGALASSDGQAGREYGGTGGCFDNQQNGVVPWVTIGLSEADSVDGWNRRITYRVGQYLWVAGGMDMTKCDPAGTDSTTATPKLCNASCASTNLGLCTAPDKFLQTGKGLNVMDAASGGNALMSTTATPTTTGAAYVLISHGRNMLGSYPAGGGSLLPITGSGDNEAPNANSTGITDFSTKIFVDRDLNEQTGSAYFDDIIRRPDIMKVILKAQRGPRAH